MSTYVIFVHGVANRKGGDYDKTVAKRTERFRKLVFGDTAKIENPYWGEFGANPAGGRYKCLPDYRDPGAGGVEVLAVAPHPAHGPAPSLIELAREDFPETVDAIYAEALDEAQEGGNSALPADLVREARMAAAYASADPNPPWLAGDLSDEAFLNELTKRSALYAQSIGEAAAPAANVELLGVGDWLKKGAKSLEERILNAGGRLALAVGRERVHNQVAAFVGDVFSYLKEGSGREPIRKLMKDALTKAVDSGDQIVLIGHSMGGVILADCLGDRQFCDSVGLKDGRKVKALVTVGSQPGFFQEINLLGMQPMPSLAVAENWINVLDELDVLSFLASPLFGGGVKDMMFSSRTGILDAHSAYFSRVQFYERLRERLRQMGVSVVKAS
ncbi:hypothetical protein [Pleomorphomonas sp. NRK KF1]|uniref:hypothetical protein n=1 Tax=Pleomorphomonas sp. NRK KF1 TaxID=2943000 RepID=UPI002044520D|nr:hypothetical protein [Pleomorphomonas sp. NRK KF1]MCM5555376.1 hypothetical protein [Pleomorphomonas sp. NRK KF1]